jgi:hypothetical protein
MVLESLRRNEILHPIPLIKSRFVLSAFLAPLHSSPFLPWIAPEPHENPPFSFPTFPEDFLVPVSIALKAKNDNNRLLFNHKRTSPNTISFLPSQKHMHTHHIPSIFLMPICWTDPVEGSSEAVRCLIDSPPFPFSPLCIFS